MNWITHILTGIDGKTVDPARVLWIVGIISFLGFAGYEVWKTNTSTWSTSVSHTLVF